MEGTAALTNESPARPRLLTSALFNSGGWATTVLLAILVTPYIVRKLTVEGYGIYALLTSLTGYYAMLDLGLGQSLVKFIPQHKVANDYGALNRSINTAVCIQILIGGLASGVLIAFADPILRWLSIPPASWDSAKTGLIACAIGFFFYMLSGTMRSLLMGLHRYDITSKIGIARDMVVNVGLVIVLFLGGQLKAAIYATVLFTLVIFVIYFRAARRNLPQWRISFAFDKESFWRMFNFGVFMFICILSQSFNVYFMRFLLSAIAGPSAVTYYTVSFKIIIGFTGFLSTSIMVLLPFSAEMAAGGNRQKLKDIFLRAAKYNAVLSLPILALMGIFSRPILSVWMGNSFAEESWLAMLLLCLASFIGSIGGIPFFIALGLGYSQLVAAFSLAAMVLVSGMAIPLIHWAGVTGAALAIALASPVWVVFAFYVAKRHFDVGFADHYNHVYKFHAVVGLPLLVATLLFQQFRPVQGVIQLAMALACPLAAYYSFIALTKWIDFDEVKQLLGSRSNA
ncbi:MAG: oligosaccharide flippase family protein [Acidobacteria bacterium]|nr:oligosaccharide flippase family protein [Acidobacteriota bacterium]